MKSRLGVLVDALLQPGALGKLREYVADVAAGEDAIEAMHGHLCSPVCWHYQMGGPEQRAHIDALVQARKARGR